MCWLYFNICLNVKESFKNVSIPPNMVFHVTSEYALHTWGNTGLEKAPLGQIQ